MFTKLLKYAKLKTSPEADTQATFLSNKGKGQLFLDVVFFLLFIAWGLLIFEVFTADASTIWNTTGCSGTTNQTCNATQKAMIFTSVNNIDRIATTTIYTNTAEQLNWGVYSFSDTSYTTALDSGSLTTTAGFTTLPINADVSSIDDFIVITLQCPTTIDVPYTICQSDSISNFGANSTHFVGTSNNFHNYANASYYMYGTMTADLTTPSCPSCPECEECDENYFPVKTADGNDISLIYEKSTIYNGTSSSETEYRYYYSPFIQFLFIYLVFIFLAVLVFLFFKITKNK